MSKLNSVSYGTKREPARPDDVMKSAGEGRSRQHSDHQYQTEQEIASETRFRLVVEAAPNAMVMINGAGEIVMVNAQAERVFGYSRAELLGQPVEMLVPARFRRHHPELRRAFFADPRPRPMGAGRDLYGLKKDGSEFPVEIGLNPIETDEGPMVLSAIVDITERKAAEAGAARQRAPAPRVSRDRRILRVTRSSARRWMASLRAGTRLPSVSSDTLPRK